MPAGGDSYGGCSGMGGGGMGSGGGGNSRGGNGGEHNYNGGSDSGGGRFSNIEGYKEGYYDGKLHIGIKYEAVPNHGSNSDYGGNARESGRESSTNGASNSNGNFNNAITKNSHKVSLSINPLLYDDSFPMGRACIQIRNALEGFLNPNEKVLNSINKFNSIYRDMEIGSLKAAANPVPSHTRAGVLQLEEHFGYWQKIIDLTPEIIQNVNEQKASDAAAKVLADKKAADDARIAKEAAIKKAAEEARVIKEVADKKAEADRQAALIKEAIEKAAAENEKFLKEQAKAKMENEKALKEKADQVLIESILKNHEENRSKLDDNAINIIKDYISNKIVDEIKDNTIDPFVTGLSIRMINAVHPVIKLSGLALLGSQICDTITGVFEHELNAFEAMTKHYQEVQDFREEADSINELLSTIEVTTND